jgi:hypothetical protein
MVPNFPEFRFTKISSTERLAFMEQPISHKPALDRSITPARTWWSGLALERKKIKKREYIQLEGT